jgi:hypothetical protein
MRRKARTVKSIVLPQFLLMQLHTARRHRIFTLSAIFRANAGRQKTGSLFRAAGANHFEIEDART